MDVAWLGEPAAHDAVLVGGKAAALSRLAAAYRVPPGFALTSVALAHAAPDLARGEMPATLFAQIDAAYETLGRPTVAVRSSAIDEDGAEHSFAGQHETFLNVEGADAIAESVMLCFASAFTQRALDYRLHIGLSVEHIGLAVLVQQLVASDVSAVVFSANPVSGEQDEIVINAGYGLGESIVGGTTTPDTFVVSKHGLAIRSRTIGDKHLMTVRTADGTAEIETPALLRGLPCLGDEQVLELARLACDLEQTLASPVDLECAIHAGVLYLLQARPITTLRPANGSGRS
jgi:pyruvate,water dikinase